MGRHPYQFGNPVGGAFVGGCLRKVRDRDGAGIGGEKQTAAWKTPSHDATIAEETSSGLLNPLYCVDFPIWNRIHQPLPIDSDISPAAGNWKDCDAALNEDVSLHVREPAVLREHALYPLWIRNGDLSQLPLRFSAGPAWRRRVPLRPRRLRSPRPEMQEFRRREYL